MEVNPLSVILVKSDSKGDRLLFRYPYEVETTNDTLDQKNGKKNPYALNVIEDLLQSPMPQTTNIHKGQLTGFTDEVLSTLFAVKPELCHRKFELKVNDVRFVGHPTLLPFRANKDDGTSSTILINIVFALQALASHSVVKCYYDLSERLGKALRHEEKRCSYLSDEMKIMIAIHDELSAMDSDSEDVQDSNECLQPLFPARSPFHLILQKSSLAMSLKTVFEDLSSTGVVQVRINQWVLVSFCLPHKAHQFHNRGLVIEPETIDRCLRSLRPYHGMLLLVDPNQLLDSIPLESSSSLIRILMLYSPLKSLQTLAIEADLPLSQIFQLTGHLVYWAKATIIYPLCESNVYVIAPDAQVHLNSPMVDKFAQDFPGLCLIQVMSMLSLPAPLWFHARAWAGGAALLARAVVWLLQKHLLLQLHTYVQFLPTSAGPPLNGVKDYYCEKHNGNKHTVADAFLSPNLVPYNTSFPNSDDSSSESYNIKSKDYIRNGDNSGHVPCGNGDAFSDSESKKGNNSYNNNLRTYSKSSSESTTCQSKTENPKNVFRENSLIFGDITSESCVDDSESSTPGSVDSVDDCNKVNGDITKNRKDSDKSDSSEEPRINRTNHWHLESSDGSVQSGVDVPDFARPMVDHSFQNNYENNHNQNGCDAKMIEAELNNNNDALSVENMAKLVNGLKIDDKNQSNKFTNKFFDEKENNSSSSSSLSDKKETNYKHLDTSFQPPTVVSAVNLLNSCDVVDTPNKIVINGSESAEQFTEEMLLADFTEEEKTALFKIPAAHNPEDLHLMTTLYKKGYFRGEQHLEEIMYMENLTRTQVLQLLDKFRDVLITYETEDPAIAMLYSGP